MAGCTYPDCDGVHHARGLCRGHYAQWQRGVDLAPLRARRPNGEGARLNGYKIVTFDGRRGPEHRFVMEGLLGRSLLPGENVHHINGRRGDNRPENLELWVTSQPAGQRVPDLLRWAQEIIDRYDT